LLKLVLSPALVAGASLAGRRFGPRISGWLIGFPVVGGPVLWFYAREQGPAFAARAAAGTVMGVVSLCVFLLVYAWSAARRGWAASLLLGWLGFVAATLGLAAVPALGAAPWPVALAAAFAALVVTRRALPRPPARASGRRPRHDLALRMAATAVLVISLTGLARVLGPVVSGLFTPFPVATTILVVFAHRDAGPAGVLAVYAGFVPGLFSFAAFCAAVSCGLDRWPLVPAFVAALLVALLSQTIVLLLIGKKSNTVASARSIS
jgi:hypothetical protein